MSKKKEKRIIMHIDMDYFFAQIEERENPHFKGHPVVVGADPADKRGVVSTCNYEARKYGLKSGMPITRAKKLCPDAIFLPVNMNFYKKVSALIFAIVKKHCSKMEKISLDEAYLDLSKRVRSFKEAVKIGRSIKKEIWQKEKITCSIGVAENKMMAKIACEMEKPDGLKVIYPSQTYQVIADMGIEVVPGIGPKSKQIIARFLGVEDPSVKQAREIKKRDLVDLFGKRGSDFFDKFKGVDNSPVVTKREIKSIGREYTFKKDTRDSEKIFKVFKALSYDVASSLHNKKKRCKGITVVCRFEDFETHTKQISFLPKNCTGKDIYKKGVPLLLDFITKKSKKVRLIGVRATVF